MRLNCSGVQSYAARMAREVLPMPPGPSMSAPQVRLSGSRASRICASSASRPKKDWRRGRLLGMEVWWTLPSGDEGLV